MRTLHDQRRRRIASWATLGPLAVLLVGGSAWAHATGYLPRLWHDTVALLMPTHAPSVPLTAIRQTDRDGTLARGEAEPSAASEEPSAASEPAASEQPSAASEEPTLAPTVENAQDGLDDATERRTRSIRPPPSASSLPPPEGEVRTPTDVAPDPELALFRTGHDLHFGASNPGAAIEAYRRYLDAYPGGRFVPEARYNTAVNLLKLGMHEPATAILSSFARGDYGAYRQREALDLLEALDKQSH